MQELKTYIVGHLDTRVYCSRLQISFPWHRYINYIINTILWDAYCKIAARTVLGNRSSWWAARYHGAGSRMILDTGKQIEMDNDGGFGRAQWKSCPQNLEEIKPRHSSEAQTFRSNSVVVPSRWSTSMYLAYIRTPIDYLRRREGGIYPINKPWSTNLAEHENKDHERNITINS